MADFDEVRPLLYKKNRMMFICKASSSKRGAMWPCCPVNTGLYVCSPSPADGVIILHTTATTSCPKHTAPAWCSHLLCVPEIISLCWNTVTAEINNGSNSTCPVYYFHAQAVICAVCDIIWFMGLYCTVLYISLTVWCIEGVYDVAENEQHLSQKCSDCIPSEGRKSTLVTLKLRWKDICW